MDDWRVRAEQLHEDLTAALDAGADEAELQRLMDQVHRHDVSRPGRPPEPEWGPETLGALKRATRKLVQARSEAEMSVAVQRLSAVAFRTAEEEDATRSGESIKAIPSGVRGQSSRR